MNIQWYPGHMTKTVRMMQDNIKLIDLIIELTDARIPESGRNPDIEKLGNGKARLLILSKADLADERVNRLWQDYYREKGLETVVMDTRARGMAKSIMPAVMRACSAKIERDKARGMKPRPIRAMVAGIPNVGKSTFINSFSGKSLAKTGNKPGVTRGKQWIRMNDKVELLDTPGLLWPKFEDERVGENIAMIGSINDLILNEDELTLTMIGRLKAAYPGLLSDRFGIDESLAGPAIMEAVGVKRGCLKKGGEVDYSRVSAVMLEEFRSGKIGRISLERPDDIR